LQHIFGDVFNIILAIEVELLLQLHVFVINHIVLIVVVEVLLLVLLTTLLVGLLHTPLLIIDHLRDLLDQLQQVDAVFGISIDDLVSADVRQIILEDLLTQEVNESLDVFGHLLLILSGSQLAKIDVGEGCLEELDIELVREEYCQVINRLLHAQVSEDVISKLDYHLHD